MRLPLATSILSRDGSLDKDSKLVNAIVEVGGESSSVMRRPGTSLHSVANTGVAQGITCWNNTTYVIAGNTIVQGPAEQAYADGTLWTSKTACPITPDEVWSDGTYIYVYQLSSSKVSRTTDCVTWETVTNAGTGLPTHNSIKIVYHNGFHYAFPQYRPGLSPTLTSVYKSSNNGASWSLLTSSASWSAREHHGVCSFNGKLWLAGGHEGSGSYKNDVWNSTDGITWTLVTASAAWAARTRIGMCGFNGQLYIGAGLNSSFTYDDVWSSSSGTSTWVEEDGTVTLVTRSNVSLITYKSKLFYGGGQQGSGNVADDVSSSLNGSIFTSKNANISSATGSMFLAATDADLFAIYTDKSTFQSTNNTSSDNTYSISAASLPISFTSTSGSAATEYLFLKNSADAWVLTFGTPGTLTQVTDADYPADTVPGAVYLNGYIFVMDANGTIYNSDLEAPLAWNPLNFISAEIEPDIAVGLAKHDNYVVAFKRNTIEFFYDAANASGSPLSRVSNSAVQLGSGSGYSLAQVDGALYFISKTRAVGISVHRFNPGQTQPEEIAPPAIQRLLNISDLTDIRCWAGRIGGHSYYVISLVTEGITIAYDVQSNSWAQWTWLTAQATKSVTITQTNGIATVTCTAHGYSDGDPVVISGANQSGYNGATNITYIDANTFSYPVSSSTVSPATGTITVYGYDSSYFPFSQFGSCGLFDFVQHETTGAIYKIGFDLTTDDGNPIDWMVRTPKLDQESTERKSMSAMRIAGDQVSGTLLIRWSDDDYQTFSDYRRVSLAGEKAEIRRLGSFRRRAVDFRFTQSAPIRISGVDIDIG